jgi:hypothetical protein
MGMQEQIKQPLGRLVLHLWLVVVMLLLGVMQRTVFVLMVAWGAEEVIA